jgi:hypothetical protein
MPNVLMTDGTKFIADKGEAYWLMTAIASYLLAYTSKENFIVEMLNVTRTATSSYAILKLDDGNENVLATQFIQHTDFELVEIKLYA